MIKKKLLLIDDESSNLNLLKNLFENHYKLAFAKNGQKALDLIQQDRPDLILLDVMMPDLNGWEVLKKLKNDPLHSSIPVIMQTGLSSVDDFKYGLSLGAYYYVEKPIKTEVLTSLVKTALKESEQLNKLKKNLEKTDAALILTDEWKFSFRTPEQAMLIAELVAKACPDYQHMLTGLVELLINAVEHGIAKIGYETKTKLIKDNLLQKEVKKRLDREEVKAKYASLHYKKDIDQIVIKIEDPGEGFNWENYLDFDIERATDNHGRGIAMAKTLSFDSLVYSKKGNSVTAKIDIKNIV